MPEYIFLSHKLGKMVPSYGKAEEIGISPVKSLKKGDSCDTFTLSLANHLGTHVDAPAHFFENGLKAADFPAETWVFHRPYVLSCELKEGEILEEKHLRDIPEDTDLLLIKSGFQRYRDEGAYSMNNPGISADAALWLRKNRPSVRAVGIDFMSVSCYGKRETPQGLEVHRAFLDPGIKGRPILIVEDMDLSADLDGLSQVIAAPFRLEGIDSSFCTVIGVRE